MKLLAAVILAVIVLQSCDFNAKTLSGKNTMKNLSPSLDQHPFTNRLINETSPYLLQHAHNPVNWYPWGTEALEKAQKENKLILVSIGYSACHWCHVMERECFENKEIASIMNEHYVCIKVDREERPDIDQVYMSAVQLMNQSGGWPLNCFTLPNGKPIYGGTYFPPKQWIEVIQQLTQVYKNDPEKTIDYAEKLTQGIKQLELIKLAKDNQKITREPLDLMVEKWEKSFDYKYGGPNSAPKFPIPNNYDFLLQYGRLTQKKAIEDFVHLTLKKMAFGGIYDQIGGGFARYSTDLKWKVPHFEKMLYDNAQLISLYAKAYRHTPDPLYKDIVFETVRFVKEELSSSEGAFFSAIDADSEGEEGKFYVWKEKELKQILADNDLYNYAKEYFNINSKGSWEFGNYVLLRDQPNKELAEKFDISENEFQSIIATIKEKLLVERNKRTKPGLDDKTLTSWNALMITGCLDAYKAFGNNEFLALATKNIQFLEKWQLQSDFRLNHSYKNGKSSINGYLEDYAFLSEAYLSLYECTFQENWLTKAENIIGYAIEHFYDKNSGMFFFTSIIDPPLIARKKEIHDNVIPASNSVIAKSLFTLGTYLDKGEYKEMATQMLANIYPEISSYGQGYSNWGILALQHTFPFYEIAISGEDFHQKAKQLSKKFIPNTLILASERESGLELLRNKWVKGSTLIYVCQNNLCKLPVVSVSEALEQIVYYDE